jgi:hypothetical protein
VPTLEEVHLGLGSGEATFDYWPDLVEDLADYAHLIFYKLGKPIGAVVILGRTPSSEGIVVSGYGLGFWQGVDKDGPIGFDREYLAGNNKLSNGGFELLDVLGDPLLWKFSEQTKWALTTSPSLVRSGARAVRVAGDLGKDDVLISTEDRDAKGGDVFAGAMWGRRAGGALVGKMRERLLFSGRFDPTNILPQPDDGAWTDLAIDGVTTNADIVGNAVKIGPIARPQVVPNPSFEDGFIGWTVIGGAGASIAPGEGYGGGNALQIQDYGGGTSLVSDYDPGTPGDQVPPVRVGDKWQFEIDMWADGADGHCEYRVFPGFSAPIAVLAFESDSRGYKHEQKLVEVTAEMAPTGTETLTVTLTQYLSTTGRFLIDNVTATRVGGNLAEEVSDPFPVTPERSYKVLANVTSDVGVVGAAWLRVRFSRDGAADVVVDLPTQQPTNGEKHLIAQSVTPPSGYDSCVVSGVGRDVFGGSFLFENLSVSLDDTSTFVVDVVSPLDTAGVYARTAGTATAPAGTEKVHLELVAEQGATGWAIDDVDFHRVGPIASPESIVDDCFRDPDTGEYLVLPGTIHGLGALAWDMHIRNSTDREVFTTLLRGGLLDQPREWRHNANNTVDVGLADELFAVRDLTFVEEDLLLLDPPQLHLSVEDRIQRLLVYGAAKQARRAGLPDVVISGEATNDPGDAVDWLGNPVNRTRVIEDSAIDYQGYADARAREEADLNAHPIQTVTVGISDPAAWDEVHIGDWVSVYKPEALIEDRTNPQTHRRTGRRIFPKLVRVLTCKRTMARGDGYEVKVRKLDGTIVDVSRYVRWDAKTKLTLELGERRADFANDPMGPAAGLQFLKHRVSGASAV